MANWGVMHSLESVEAGYVVSSGFSHVAVAVFRDCAGDLGYRLNENYGMEELVKFCLR